MHDSCRDGPRAWRLVGFNQIHRFFGCHKNYASGRRRQELISAAGVSVRRSTRGLVASCSPHVRAEHLREISVQVAGWLPVKASYTETTRGRRWRCSGNVQHGSGSLGYVLAIHWRGRDRLTGAAKMCRKSDPVESFLHRAWLRMQDPSGFTQISPYKLADEQGEYTSAKEFYDQLRGGKGRNTRTCQWNLRLSILRSGR